MDNINCNTIYLSWQIEIDGFIDIRTTVYHSLPPCVSDLYAKASGVYAKASDLYAKVSGGYDRVKEVYDQVKGVYDRD